MTLEGLLELLASQRKDIDAFMETGRREFYALAARFDRLELKMSGFAERLEGHGAIGTTVEEHDAAIDVLDRRMSAIERSFAGIRHGQEQLLNHVDRLSDHVTKAVARGDEDRVIQSGRDARILDALDRAVAARQT